MNDNQAKYPQLRFKGFTDPWKQRKLGELVTYQNGVGHEGNQLDEGKYELVNLNSIAIDGGLKNSGKFINKTAETLLKNDLVMVLSDVGHGDLLGRVAIIPENYRYVLNQRVALLRGNSQTNIRFLFSYINAHQMYFKREGAGSSQLNISRGSVERFKVYLPSISEQKQIGDFFKQLDSQITIHQRKLAKLKELKQGYLQKLFPQNGSKFPQLRFAGFADAWEQRKLGDIVVFLNGRAYKQAELLDSGKYPVLRVGNFNTNDKWYYSDLELPAKNYADKGDLLYTWATAFGPHIWKGPKVIYHYHIWKVETTSDISKNFAVHLLDADQAQMTNSLNGSTMVHITKGTMENKIVTIPGISEQRNMARLLDQLDFTIALHQRKLEKLQELKKGYLQKMFC
ncbi:restriction endonuclease subunit S [Lacticaseibacillus paracasei]|uniref:restriction endonuclease subunit S n=1 Tax=Lacticaseibacillus paracasei TaxID=1597 RepID=UPI000E59A605|nr:restriction endonuclease subunit S [Lacticaseibacillus paracasei]RHX71636.1 restriction endonuclease subunit S [Lacticaseibacillus paracasei]